MAVSSSKERDRQIEAGRIAMEVSMLKRLPAFTLFKKILLDNLTPLENYAENIESVVEIISLLEKNAQDPLKNQFVDKLIQKFLSVPENFPYPLLTALKTLTDHFEQLSTAALLEALTATNQVTVNLKKIDSNSNRKYFEAKFSQENALKGVRISPVRVIDNKPVVTIHFGNSYDPEKFDNLALNFTINGKALTIEKKESSVDRDNGNLSITFTLTDNSETIAEDFFHLYEVLDETIQNEIDITYTEREQFLLEEDKLTKATSTTKLSKEEESVIGETGNWTPTSVENAFNIISFNKGWNREVGISLNYIFPEVSPSSGLTCKISVIDDSLDKNNVVGEESFTISKVGAEANYQGDTVFSKRINLLGRYGTNPLNYKVRLTITDQRSNQIMLDKEIK
jgi:hypothetical protein